MKRRIYLVRHGLTVSNEKETVQDPEDPLNPRGIEQAKILAERFAKISFNTLVSSNLPRAKDTAQTIGDCTGHIALPSALLRETSYPSILFGALHSSPEVAAYYKEQNARREDPHYRFGDEETFTEIRARAKAALEYLQNQEGTVVVVSHGLFIRKIIFQILFGDALTQQQEYLALKTLLTNNTGITALEEHDNEWKLLTWNDHAHLG